MNRKGQSPQQLVSLASEGQGSWRDDADGHQRQETDQEDRQDY